MIRETDRRKRERGRFREHKNHSLKTNKTNTVQSNFFPDSLQGNSKRKLHATDVLNGGKGWQKQPRHRHQAVPQTIQEHTISLSLSLSLSLSRIHAIKPRSISFFFPSPPPPFIFLLHCFVCFFFYRMPVFVVLFCHRHQQI